MSKTPDELFAERTKRMTDAIELKVPDRVPLFFIQELFPAHYAGITYQQAFYDQEKWLAANEKTILDFDPDMFFFLAAGVFSPGTVMEGLGLTQMKWPGHGVGVDTPFQFVEGEYMKPEEYDLLLEDPSDFAIRTYLPRCYTALDGLRLLPPLKGLLFGGYGASALTPALLAPPVVAAMEALNKAAVETARWADAENAFYAKMAQCGYPAITAAVTFAPYDMISDLFRGMRGTMLDMYRCPDKLLAAQEMLTPTLLGTAIAVAQMSGNPRVFIPLHRGADGFMSVKQFEEFYWPGLKKIMLGLIDAGLTPVPFFEGTYDQRLEYLREMPKGKVLGWFDRSDLFKAKEVIGDVMCIAGDMPVSLLQSGTPEQVKAYTKKLIDEVGKGGGYIMTSNTALDDTRPDLVKVWMDYSKEYGVY
jgi:uroporphyrinogen-III decarboxylase